MSYTSRHLASLTLAFAVTASAALADNKEDRAFKCDTPDLSGLSLPDVVENLLPANVVIQAKPNLTELQILSGVGTVFPTPPPSWGSGFIIDPNGLMVTAAHVVNNGDVESVTVTTYDPHAANNLGEKFTATLVGVDTVSDTAVLKINPNPENVSRRFNCVNFGDSSKLRMGETAYALGAPLEQGFSLSVGLVSNSDRIIPTKLFEDGYEEFLFDYIQTDAAVNLGNSGGLGFDNYGLAMGIVQMIISSDGGNVGLGLLLPIDDAKEVIHELIQDGRVIRAGLGVQVSGIDSNMANTLKLQEGEGVVIRSIVENEATAKTGLQVDDVVLNIGDTPIKSRIQFARLIADHEPGDEIRVQILRKGLMETLDITLPDREDALKETPEAVPAPPPPTASATPEAEVPTAEAPPEAEAPPPAAPQILVTPAPPAYYFEPG